MKNQENNLPTSENDNQENNDDALNIVNQNDFVDQQFKDNKEEQQEINAATEASEPSFTLQPEKGLTPDPQSYNEDEPDDYNLKQ